MNCPGAGRACAGVTQEGSQGGSGSLRSEGAAPGPRQGGHSRWFWEGFQSWVCLDLVFINCGPALAVPKCPVPGTLCGAVPMGDVGWENIEDGDGAGPSFLKHLHIPHPFLFPFPLLYSCWKMVFFRTRNFHFATFSLQTHPVFIFPSFLHLFILHSSAVLATLA